MIAAVRGALEQNAAAAPPALTVLAIICSLVGAPVVLRGPDRCGRPISVAENRRRAVPVIISAPATAAAAAPAPACTHGQPDAARSAPALTLAFVVDGIKCRQRDVGDFLLTEDDFVGGVIRCWVQRRMRKRRGRSGQKRYSRDAQHGRCLTAGCSLGRFLQVRHFLQAPALAEE